VLSFKTKSSNIVMSKNALVLLTRALDNTRRKGQLSIRSGTAMCIVPGVGDTSVSGRTSTGGRY
jgi:hypothetical protein